MPVKHTGSFLGVYPKNRNSNPDIKVNKPLKECRNIQKQNSRIRLLYKHLADIRNNHIYQSTCGIVKTKPSRIVMETLNVKGMMKNRHLSKAVAQQEFYEFNRQIGYKSK